MGRAPRIPRSRLGSLVSPWPAIGRRARGLDLSLLSWIGYVGSGLGNPDKRADWRYFVHLVFPRSRSPSRGDPVRSTHTLYNVRHSSRFAYERICSPRVLVGMRGTPLFNQSRHLSSPQVHGQNQHSLRQNGMGVFCDHSASLFSLRSGDGL
ncbi:uncharacterized protein C8Q71DRAFT_235302 [Rhodofomes roseus]|uniref:Uncharacterized protein n=1 Tax=Rhodofomes roseus TaxID=34475 RepID=A0ABQ8KVP3_9APHY|nr:uncharacterized protein C8Q71DRAFT_235302 [Rhodofomes roseus]KAH9843108.1 hypothetical protein C8Q71DRAFT_235302 [Rhodofomes roseus]